MAKRMSWHKSPDDTDYEFAIFRHYLFLPYEKPAQKKRTLSEAFRRYCVDNGRAVVNPPNFLFKARKQKAWDERAHNYDAHIAAKLQEGEDRGIVKGAEKEAAKRAEGMAISVERMRGEMADFVDDVGPKVRERLRNMLSDEDTDISAASLAQIARVVLDTVKLLDRGEGDNQIEGFTDEDWEKFLAQETPEEDS